MSNLQDLAKYPRWLILIGFGLGAVILAVAWASLASADIYGVQIKPDPESASRYVGAAVLGLLGLVLIGFGLKGRRTEHKEADLKHVPVERIEIKDVRLETPRPHDPQYWASGSVTPPQPRVKVWLLRESLAQGTGKFTLNGKGHAITDEDGKWEQSIGMWPGKFYIHAVVTTDENEKFYRWAISARQAALKIVQQQQQNTNSYDVPGWPPLESLPDPCRSDKYRIDV